MKRIIFIILLLVVSVSVFSQFSPTVDTLRLYRGGKIWYLRITEDTLFINADTIYTVIDYYLFDNDTIFLNDDTIPVPVYKYLSAGEYIVINTDTLYVQKQSEGFMYFTTVDVSIIQFDNLHLDSVVCIPSPGVDKYINVVNAVVRVSANRNAEIGTGELDMTYNTAANGGYDEDDVIRYLPSYWVEKADTNQWFFPHILAEIATIINTKQTANKSVVLWLTDQNTGDDTSLKLYITYQILSK
jgi:hypothetical protein